MNHGHSEQNDLIAKFEKIVFTFAKYLCTISSILLALMMFLAASDVILRYLFHRPLTGAKGMVEVMLALCTSLGVAYSEVIKRHITIDFLTNRLSEKTKYSFEAATDVLSTGILVVVSYALFKYAYLMKTSGLVVGDIDIPIYPFVYITAFGWTYFALTKFFVVLRQLKERGAQFWSGAVVGILILCLLSLALRGSNTNLGPSMVGFIGVITLLILAFSGMNMGLAMMVISFFGIAYIGGLRSGFGILGIQPYSVAASYNYSVYPLFIYMGTIVFVGGLGEDLFKSVHKWLGHISGGLAMASVIASAGFAAISGSGTSNAATMGKVALPEMEKYNYNVKLSAGAIAAGGTIGPLIPPSTVFVLYGILTQQPIGKLFVAGILPGIFKALVYMVVIYFLCKRNPTWGPKGPKASLKERVISIKNIWSVAILFSLVMGGLYAGVFTPSEAAGIGAFGAFLCAMIKAKFSFKRSVNILTTSSVDTGNTVGALFCMLAGANIFGNFLSVTRIPFELADYVASLAINRFFILGILIAIFLLLGCIMDILSVVVVVVPVVFPVITALGFDPIWFGVLVCWLFEIGALTPPVGVNIFVLKTVVPRLNLEDIFRGVTPFYIADMVMIVILVAFPQIATFLPKLMW